MPLFDNTSLHVQTYKITIRRKWYKILKERTHHYFCIFYYLGLTVTSTSKHVAIAKVRTLFITIKTVVFEFLF